MTDTNERVEALEARITSFSGQVDGDEHADQQGGEICDAPPC